MASLIREAASTNTASEQMLPTAPSAERAAHPFPTRAVVAAFLSMLVPGTGQIFLGARRRGLLMIAVTLGIVAAAVAFSPRQPLEMLELAVQPRYLAGLLIADIGLLVFRIFAVVDAYRLGKPDRLATLRHPVLVAALATLLLVTLIPHALVGYYDLVTYRFITDVFDEKPATSNQPAPAEVELSRPVRLNPNITPAAPPTVAD
jgi:hypothetical protein